jgi:hypothetical protein
MTDTKPKDPNRAGKRFFGVALLGAIVLMWVAVKTTPESTSTASASTAATCVADWSKCTDNSEMANNYKGWTHAHYECKRAAEEQAKYGDPKWPWLAFGTFYKGDDYVKTGIGRLVEPKAQFQNGFGAWARVEVVCSYDLRADKVQRVLINEN